MKTLLKTWVSIIALSTLSLVSHAQTLNKVTYMFAIPQGIDPPTVIDLSALNTVQSFTGADLLDDGVEIHSRIPGLTPGTFRDILQLQFLLYTGGQPFGINVTTTPPFTAWDSSAIATGNPNYELVTLTAAPGSAPINDHFSPGPGIDSSYLVFTATATGDPAYLTALRNSTSTVEATVQGLVDRGAPVPEPAALGLALGLLGTTGSCLLARRRSRCHQS